MATAACARRVCNKESVKSVDRSWEMKRPVLRVCMCACVIYILGEIAVCVCVGLEFCFYLGK